MWHGTNANILFSSVGMLQSGQEITEVVRHAERVKQDRYEKQIEYKELYENLVVEAKERIRKERSAIIEETIRSEVRNWVNTYFQQTGKIPDLPSAESGGSRIIFSRQVKLIFALELCIPLYNKMTAFFALQGTESTISKSTAVSSKESKKSKRSKSKKDSDAEQSEDETEQGFKSVPSNFLSNLVHANQEYQEVWKTKDESTNAKQMPYLDMIENEKTKEVENEVRVTVDQVLRGKFLNENC